jgi:indole-3-glycerol phosphate synthase
MSRALRHEHVAIIAEIKRSSPSKGSINPSIDPTSQAAAYEKGGASAISVLTEPLRFGGSNDDLLAVRNTSKLPILKKDFHVTEVQLEEASSLGASAALVIVRAIEPAHLRDLAQAAEALELELIFEIRDETELERALDSGATMIGVNNRNLETLHVHEGTAERIIRMIPAECIAIAESGYMTRAEIENVALAGADAVLVGSSLSASRDPQAAVHALAGVKRVPRA